ncbi:MAG TPA: BlaI/MecI/CopY family transcriptional regulator [Longimicrobium sp.]|jgi:predicted transcriptional regulator
MPAKSSLTDLQLELMRVLWRRGEATVGDVQRDLGATRGIAQSTVATLLRRLEAKGAVTHRSEGRSFIYSPALVEDEVQRSMIGSITERLFTGDVPTLISHLLAERDVTREELAEVKAMIAAKEKTLDDAGQGGSHER